MSVFLVIMLIAKITDFSNLHLIDYLLFTLLGIDAVLTVALIIRRHTHES
jgi:hypothetical protein